MASPTSADCSSLTAHAYSLRPYAWACLRASIRARWASSSASRTPLTPCAPTSPLPYATWQDDSGSLLGCAAFKGHAAIVELLLDYHADTNGRDESGKLPTFLTPLMHAAYNGRTDVVRILLERNAQPNIGHDRQTHMALDFAEMQACHSLPITPWL